VNYLTLKSGILTPFLLKQKPGARQIKIRGNFNTPVLQKTPYGYEFPDNLVFFSAGSGITPFLQIIASAILPVNTPLAVIIDFTQTQADEIPLVRGEYVSVISHSYDGINAWFNV
jgi:ferredoxin-NADP reductase